MSEEYTMTVSVDGLRRNLARAYSRTVSGFREVIEGCNIEEFSELKEGLDDMRQMIAGLMCVYSSNPDDLMTDMGDEADKLPYADPKESDADDDSETLRDHTLAWLDSIGADGLMIDGHFIQKDNLEEDASDWEGGALLRLVPAFRHADGSYHSEAESLCPCDNCIGARRDACTYAKDCLEYGAWLAHREAK